MTRYHYVQHRDGEVESFTAIQIIMSDNQPILVMDDCSWVLPIKIAHPSQLILNKAWLNRFRK